MFTFDEFYEALYSEPSASEKRSPFPWQTRLAQHVVNNGWVSERPSESGDDCLVLDLPTSSGKTSAIDVAVYHLVQQVMEGEPRSAALRIFFIVDRRIVVDGTFRHAQRLADRLAAATEGPLHLAAEALRAHFHLGADERPLHVSVMRGGMYRDDGWARSPVQPTICVSTVDQVGSRLLFRGYGVTASMRPIHAGLVANDSLLFIDEAHLSEPFLQTLSRVREIGHQTGDEGGIQKPLQFVRMSATNSHTDSEPFGLRKEDRKHAIMKLRLEAKKIATFEKVKVDSDDREAADETFATRLAELALTCGGLEDEPSGNKKKRKKKSEDVTGPTAVIGIVVNRVRTAQMIHANLRRHLRSANHDSTPKADVILLTGRIRPFDRDELLFRREVHGRHSGWLPWIAADRDVESPRPVIVVATQTVEVGADISFDTLITEAAPLDCLRQRFGRLDRLGNRKVSSAVIAGRSTSVSKSNVDAIYGKAIGATWAWLNSISSGSGKNKSVDFGLNAIEDHLDELGSDELSSMLAPKQDAPYLQEKYTELWSRTNPTPAADPEVSIFLHGVDAGLPDVQVVWRCDLFNNGETKLEAKYEADYINTVALLPPTRMEACSVPIWEIHRLLSQDSKREHVTGVSAELSDVEGTQAVATQDASQRAVLVWRGPERQSRKNPRGSHVALASRIQPGDTIVLSSSTGGCDEFGWNPTAKKPVRDVAESCARWSRGRAVIRVHPALLGQYQLEGSIPLSDDRDAVDAFLRVLSASDAIPPAFRASARELQNRRSVAYEFQNKDDDTGNGPFVVIGKQRVGFNVILQESQGAADAFSTSTVSPIDDDSTSFSAERRVSLDEHTSGVVRHATRFGKLLFSTQLQQAVSTAAEWHDLGKIDYRFQVMLHNGEEIDAVVAMENAAYLAKSEIPWNNRAARRRARRRAAVPDNFRHEALSVLLLRSAAPAVGDLSDTDLVEFLIGSHHGVGRPFFPVCIDNEPINIDDTWRGHHFQLNAADRHSQSLHRIESDWPSLVSRLNRRYGVWGLAWLEAVFRLADHRQSAIDQQVQESGKEMSADA